MVLIFKLFLSLIGLSIGSLFFASALSWLELAALASLVRSATIFIWLGAYLVITLQTGFYLLKSTVSELHDYFNPIAREQRRLLFIQYKSEQLKQRHLIRRRHLKALYEAKRLSLLEANNKKHANNPSSSINLDFSLVKQQWLQRFHKTPHSDKFIHSQQRIADFKP